MPFPQLTVFIYTSNPCSFNIFRKFSLNFFFENLSARRAIYFRSRFIFSKLLIALISESAFWTSKNLPFYYSPQSLCSSGIVGDNRNAASLGFSCYQTKIFNLRKIKALALLYTLRNSSSLIPEINSIFGPAIFSNFRFSGPEPTIFKGLFSLLNTSIPRSKSL